MGTPLRSNPLSLMAQPMVLETQRQGMGPQPGLLLRRAAPKVYQPISAMVRDGLPPPEPPQARRSRLSL